MKIRILPFTFLLLFAACTTQPKTETSILSGEFLYYNDAAVLNTGSAIFGAVIDDKLHELHQMVAPIQKDSFDMVQVYLKGIIIENTGDGWPQLVRITEIDSVSQSKLQINQLIEIRSE